VVRLRILPGSFYRRDTTIVARDLLGMVLERKTPDGITSGRIVEVEAYLGPNDPASHAAPGLTARNVHLFGPPGIAYDYFIYGRYWCVNAVSGRKGAGTAVLIRALEPLDGVDIMRERRGDHIAVQMLTNGPARLCLALSIDKRLSGTSLQRGGLVIREGAAFPDKAISVSPRIGITRAASWPLRYYVTGNRYVSRTPRAFPVEVYRPGRSVGA
jgi:DNA-3-methyladenine glycosylase